MTRRTERLGEEIREEVARMITGELKDPRIGFVTVTRVDLGPDLRQARIYVGVLGTREAAARRASPASSRRRGSCAARWASGCACATRRSCVFQYDEGLEASDRVARLLDEIQQPAAGSGHERRRRRGLAPVDGVLVVDKPAGPTSHDVVDHVRRSLRERRAGHTGTLDPFATGVLPVCLGKATRLARFLAAGEKTYRATVRLGFATTTDDLTGEPLVRAAPRVGDRRRRGRRRPRAWSGQQLQVPPAYSAKRSGGERLYDLARRGVVVDAAAGAGGRPRPRRAVRAGRPGRDPRPLRARHLRARSRPRPRGGAGHGRPPRLAAARRPAAPSTRATR